MKLFLVGFMGSGKSTFGKNLATHLQIPFFDLDDYIVQKKQTSITKIFKHFGDDTFRKYEQEALSEIIHNHIHFVLSTGGGTPCYNNNMELMLANGFVIYLKLAPEHILTRIRCSSKDRPLIQQFTTEDELLNWIEKTLIYREQFYSKANLTIDALNIKPKKLLQYLKQLNIEL